MEFHKLRRQGRAKSINEKIRHARNFKNPYMLNWLVSHCGIVSHPQYFFACMVPSHPLLPAPSPFPFLRFFMQESTKPDPTIPRSCSIPSPSDARPPK